MPKGVDIIVLDHRLRIQFVVVQKDLPMQSKEKDIKPFGHSRMQKGIHETVNGNLQKIYYRHMENEVAIFGEMILQRWSN